VCNTLTQGTRRISPYATGTDAGSLSILILDFEILFQKGLLLTSEGCVVGSSEGAAKPRAETH
jgi:hypothetical protein